jgi:catechol 2,3-dioxygenase-like lactoylglutathione lyase family enzyme
MIIVDNIDESKRFYASILQTSVTLDLTSYIVTEGFSMMTRDKWNEIAEQNAAPADETAHSFELYFEEDAIDDFALKLKTGGIVPFNPLSESAWGQKSIRFLDPDGYVIEVAESMKAAVKRALISGMTTDEAAIKTMMPLEFARRCEAELGRR